MGEEVFFDTSDCLVSEESLVTDYEVWLKEPQSIKERRDIFLSRMGFVELGIERTPEGSIDDERRNSNSEANCSDQDWLDDISIDMDMDMKGQTNGNVVSAKQCGVPEKEKERKVKRWWRHLLRRRNKSRDGWMRMQPNRKKCVECTCVFAGQKFKAHNSLIWTMKFSHDGQYLASGGQDGLICIWRVSMVDADKCSFGGSASVIIPEKIFHIEEEPVHKLYGHSSNVLDLAWSTSNYLLSSSMDQTVRLWKAGSDQCLGLFHHSNYVTCVQFNPVDENYFISGSIDGKVRIWGIRKRRVVDWANMPDIVTAVCYKPNGKGFVVGSVSGTCYFYESSGSELVLNAQVNVHGRKKSSGCRITGIQFLKNEARRVMVTSEDSKIRILDGLAVVRKYRGLTKSGSQISASFTSSGRHIVSIGGDSRVYLWNNIDLHVPTSSKQAKSIRSCEYLFSEGATFALPWPGSGNDVHGVVANDCCDTTRLRDPERFSLANWFSLDNSSRACTTWPEEKLPLLDLPSVGYERKRACSDHLHQLQNKIDGSSETWGLVFVTANHDGTIKTFHNYGLPIRV